MRCSIRVIVDCITKWGHDPEQHSLHSATLRVYESTISLLFDTNPIAFDPAMRGYREIEWSLCIPETLEDGDQCLVEDGAFLNDELVYSYHLYVFDSCN
jgi:hypothetical protein